MSEQVQISIDHELYDMLQKLSSPPDDINAVLRRLMFNAGKVKSGALLDTEEDSKHRSFEDELKATSDGVYGGSGIFP